MPHKPDRLGWVLPATADRRRKLTADQREAIRENPEGLTQRELATRYMVSRRLVQFIQTPAKQAANLEARQRRGGWRQYYRPEQHTEAMRATRHHRLKVYKKGRDITASINGEVI